jgi:heme exporter protein B
MSAALVLLGRDLRLAIRRPADSVVAVAFFVIAAALFPFGVGADPDVLARIAPGIIWVTALLATLLSVERLFLNDYEDGSLDQLALAPLGLAWAAAGKALAHWLVVGLPLLIASPLLALLLGMNLSGFGILLLALLLGTPTLVLIGMVAAALTVGARRGGALLALLALPLDVPVLIFGAGAVEAAVAGMPAGPHLQVLAGLLLGALALAPAATAAALNQALE